MRHSDDFSTFKKSILRFIRLSPNSIFNYHSPNGITLIARLRLGISHIREHKFRHNFQDTLKLWDDIKTTIHYLLHCPNYFDEKKTILNSLQNYGENIHDKHDSSNNDASSTWFWMLPSNIYWLLKDLTSLFLTLELFEIFTFLNMYPNTTIPNKMSHTSSQ